MSHPSPISRRGFLGVAGLFGAWLLSGCGLTRATKTPIAGVPAAMEGPVEQVSPPPPPPAAPAAADVLSDVFVTPRTARAAKKVEVIAREGWGAKRPKPVLRPHSIERLTVHHSATPLRDNREAPAHFRLYQRIHRRKRPDIAYHFLIDRKGNVYEGRPALASGESTDHRHGYDATGHLLVMCDGNFMTQKPSKRQLSALADVLAWASVRFAVSPNTITGHRDHAATACPGTKLYKVVHNGALERTVEQRIARGGVDLVLVEGTRAKRRVAAIEGRA